MDPLTPPGPVPTHEMLAHHAHLTEQARGLMADKSNDYARANDTLTNFKTCELLGVCPTATGVFVRLTDKMSRLANYASGKEMKVADETSRDAILDAINYLVILDKILTGATVAGSLTFEDLKPLPE